MITIDSSARALHLGFVPPKATAPAAAATTPAAPAAAGSDTGFSFNDLLDIVNPLQHIPVVSTIYRAISGDTIKTFPKIAGDTLYGGLEGLASSVADTVFTKITGKSVGDTVLDFAEKELGLSKPAATGVAAADAPASPTTASISTPAGEDFVDRAFDWVGHLFTGSPATAPVSAVAPANLPVVATAQPAMLHGATDTSDAIVVPGQDELLMALNRNGVGSDVALRAADAYRRTMNATAAASAPH
jgi:hypothetical protein